ncbi:MAG: hypothetical protein IKE55_09505 [Kiritimatiellae bacterium]|jgi:hypothetical protein|nr:hypothetical protein [Kiritimatiellia bacterium]
MKKLITLAMIAAAVAPVFAQESEAKSDEPAPAREERGRGADVWPAFVAVCEFPDAPDVVGLRLTIPFSTRQENVTGIDIGLWGRSLYFEGLQVNLLRNDVKDDASGVQVGLYNSVGGGDLLGIQAGLWNEANSMRGAQVGLVNISGETEGLQVGIINRSETMYGYQIGLINVIRDAEIQFFPIVNIGF